MNIPAQRPQNVVIDLDQRWSGVDERGDGAVLPGSSEVANGAPVRAAVNARFTEGDFIQTRPCYVHTPQYNRIPHWLAETAPKHVGAGSYVDPVTRQGYVLLAADDYMAAPGDGQSPRRRRVWLCRSDAGPQVLPVQWEPGPWDADSVEEHLCRFTQIGGEVIMWRRDGLAPRLWTGERDEGFVDIASVDAWPETPDYYVPLPAVEWGINAAERLVFPYGGGIGWTDIDESRRWDVDAAVLNVGDDGGRVTGMLWWRQSTLLVFKERSVWAVENWSGDLSAIAVRPISRQVGCLAPDTVVEVGEDVVWLANGGLYSLRKLLAAQDTAVMAVPLSYTVPVTFGRINWGRAHLSCGVFSRGHYYLAVPLDGALVPDTLLTLGVDKPGWQGRDTIDGTAEYIAMVRCVLWGGESHLVVRKEDALVHGWSWQDVLLEGLSGDIPLTVEMRGYHAPEHGFTRWVRVQVETEECGTQGVTLTAKVPGQHREIPLQGSTTRDRTRWKARGLREPRDMSNDDDDFSAPGREDYAFGLEEGGVELHSGVYTALLQAHSLAGSVTGVARSLAPVVRTTGGKLRINIVGAAGVR